MASLQSGQTGAVFLGAQDCLDAAWPCPSMRNSTVGPDSSAWQQAGRSDWRQDFEDDEVLKSPSDAVISDCAAASSRLQAHKRILGN